METRTVFTAITGKPNAGKSTLLNRLIKSKLAITAPKPQTTRARILGIYTEDGTQYVFTDTPGFHSPRTRLGEHMVKTVRDSVSDADVTLFLAEPFGTLSESEKLLAGELRDSKIPVILVLNKCDTVSPEKAEKLLEELSEETGFVESICVSALTGKNCDRLMELISAHALSGPHLYDEDALTDMPEKQIAAELIREKLLMFLQDELPHGCAVVIESFSERANSDMIDIGAAIVCEKNSHKAMIIGKGGAMIKKIGTAARAEIEAFLDCRVNLKCFVKVREGWRDNEQFIKEFGLQ